MSHTRKFRKPAKKCKMAIIFDFDEVLHACTESDAQGLIKGTLIDPESIRRIITLAINHDLPLLILTSRANTEIQKKYIIDLIDSIDGFYQGPGGFHIEDIHCLGVEAYSKKHRKTCLISQTKPKLKMIEEIHQNKFPHLSKDDLIFIDDEEKNIEPSKEAGYYTIKAKTESSEHLQTLISHIQDKIRAEYTSTLFFAQQALDLSEDAEIKKERQLTLN